MLRDVDRVFGILSAQRKQLAQLAADSDAILGPLARERRHFAGFITNSGAAAEASAEKGPELEEALRKFPVFLRRVPGNDGGPRRPSPTPARRCSKTSAPRRPSLTDATKTLTPFSEALTVSLKSLGDAGEASGPIFAEADPVVRKAGELAKSGVKPTENLAKLFVNLKTDRRLGRADAD